METRDSLWVALVKSAAAAAPVLLFLYAENPQFRWAVDDWLARLRYRVRLVEWRARYWDRWSPHERERFEERHGLPPEA